MTSPIDYYPKNTSLVTKNAFSLVELSIVLVILGLLTGGILTGQSLIRAAELRSITTEFNQWQTVVSTFKGKYFALPGDMPNATQFWGSASGASCNHGTAATGTGTQTCNGDGNGNIRWGGAANQYVEMFMFWQHLANAGLINGTYTGKSGSGAEDHAIIGQNSAASKLSGAGWTLVDELFNLGFSNGTYDIFGGYKYPMIFGGQFSNWELWGEVLTAEEAWNIDKKIDDGMPHSGKVGSDYSPDCVTGATPPQYNLTNTSKCTALYFLQD